MVRDFLSFIKNKATLAFCYFAYRIRKRLTNSHKTGVMARIRRKKLYPTRLAVRYAWIKLTKKIIPTATLRAIGMSRMGAAAQAPHPSNPLTYNSMAIRDVKGMNAITRVIICFVFGLI